MPNYTENYNLIKPKKEENYDIDETTNKNMDTIDAELFKRVNKVPGKGLSTNDFTDEWIARLKKMIELSRGFTFIPIISEDGVISWSNDGNLENPQPINIMGPQGPEGKTGNGILSITSISRDAIGVTYSINFTNGDYYLFTVLNGETGPANNITIGTVEIGDQAEATITGEAPNQILNLVLPRGAKGDTPDMSNYSTTEETRNFVSTMIDEKITGALGGSY